LAECDLPGPEADQSPATLEVSSNQSVGKLKCSQSEVSIQDEIIATSPNEMMLQTDISKMRDRQKAASTFSRFSSTK